MIVIIKYFIINDIINTYNNNNNNNNYYNYYTFLNNYEASIYKL
jgi:hypothetical protein